MNKIVKQTLFVNGLVHNEKQQVLMLRRSIKDHFLPGYLELPGGKVQLGETMEHALKRKLQLEANIAIEMPQYYMSLAQIASDGPYVRVVFEVAYNSDNATLKLSGVHDEYLWVNSSQTFNEKLTSDSSAILERYLGKSSQTHDSNTALTIYTDGGSRGNPGPSASAYVIYDHNEKILGTSGAYIGITTNSQAEYTAVLLALKEALRFAGEKDVLLLKIDSLLVVNQMNGVYSIKNRELWPLNQQIRDIIKRFKAVRFQHIPREQNTVADAKVNEILDAHKN